MSLFKLRTLDLFSGCGGLSYGLESVKRNGKQIFKTGLAIDNWDTACNTLKTNLGAEVVCSSVSSDDVLDLVQNGGSFDLVVGGPPCQGFSTSGKRALDDPRNDLVWAFLKVVERVKPRLFVMENVSGFANFSGGKLLKEVKEQARELGYHPRAGLLQASMHGVPQRRRRFFLVGSLREGFKFPGEQQDGLIQLAGTGLDFEEKIVASEEISFNDAVSDLPSIAAGSESDNYKSPPLNDFQEKMRAQSDKLSMHVAVGHGDKMLNLMKFLPEGKSAFDSEVFPRIPEELRPKGGFKNSYARIDGSKPAPTITRNFTTPSSANCIHPRDNRALSLREGARAQSFPDHFRFLGNTEEIRLQIGNAVPPLLAKALGEAIAEHLFGGE